MAPLRQGGERLPVSMKAEVNGLVSLTLYEVRTNLVIGAPVLITSDAGTYKPNGVILGHLEGFGRFRGHASANGRRVAGRIVLLNAGRPVVRRFQLEWIEPPHGVIVQMINGELLSRSLLQEVLSPVDREALIEARRRMLEQAQNGGTEILPPTPLDGTPVAP